MKDLVIHAQLCKLKNVSVARKNSKHHAGTKEWHVAKSAVQPLIVESMNARENVMKEVVDHAQRILKEWSSAHVAIILSNNLSAEKEKLAQILFQTAITLVIDTYHVASISARNNAIQVSVKHVTVWPSNHVDVEETLEMFLVTPLTILMTLKKK